MVIARHKIARANTFALGIDQDGRTVFVAARHHQDMIPGQSVVTSKSISRQVRSYNLSDMCRAFRVGPCHTDENMFIHLSSISLGNMECYGLSNYLAYYNMG